MDFPYLEQQFKMKENEMINFHECNSSSTFMSFTDNNEKETKDEITFSDISPHKESDLDYYEDNFSDLHGYDSSDEEFDGPECKMKENEEELSKHENIKLAAEEYKKIGNELVNQRKYEEAIEPYTKAIKLYNQDPIFFANRAVCFIKMENFKASEADCSEAIKLDYKYVKAYIRRASARKALNNLEGACRDLQSIVILEPNNITVKNEFIALRDQLLENKAFHKPYFD
ncbi:RNA polymerase II-associated protein 3-like [Cimex lectularius]|uniref:Tetratricopeptide repeat protein n=1 Tax=Cimex lectularius TaxID=79782 RepID=A0A8I6RUB3_CIMLE|nr:RNA polymerase II-associated protein 3-like [Cimex lectularius]